MNIALTKRQKQLLLSQLRRTIADAPLIIQEMQIDCADKQDVRNFRQEVIEMRQLKKVMEEYQ